MNLKIGAKIKDLRKRDDITQERLADVLGVTNQVVLRWESEAGYPDIEYILPIANFFNVTIDYLFDHDTLEKRRKVQAYLVQYDKRMLVKPFPGDELIGMMRCALAEFPAEETLLLKLAEALFWKWQTYGTWTKTENGFEVPDAEKAKSFDSWEESMKIMEELLATSTDDAVRRQCRQWLAHIYGAIGDKAKLVALAEKCGSMHGTKEMVLAYGAWGEDGLRYKQELLSAMLLHLQNTMRFLAKHSDVETRIETHRMLINLHKFIFRDDVGIHDHWLTFLYTCAAKPFHDANQPDEALAAYEQAFSHAKKFGEFAKNPGKAKNTTPFTNFIKQEEIHHEPGSEVHNLLDYLLDEEVQASFSGNKRFTSLVKKIEAWKENES